MLGRQLVQRVLTGAIILSVIAGHVEPVWAQQQDLGQVLDRVSSLGRNFYNLIGVVAALLGTGLAGLGLYKCYHARQNPNDPSAKVSTGLLMIFIGSAMIALPEVLGVGITSLFGSGAEKMTIIDDLEGLR